MNLIIRKANEQDFPAVLSLIKEFSVFQKTPAKVTITLEEMIKGKNVFRCLVAEVDNKIVGLATFFIAYYSWTGKGMYLDDLYVTESFRKLAIGKRLLHSVIDLAKSEQCKRVRWQVSKWNENAIDFYKKMGATVDGTDINCDLKIASN